MAIKDIFMLSFEFSFLALEFIGIEAVKYINRLILLRSRVHLFSMHVEGKNYPKYEQLLKPTPE